MMSALMDSAKRSPLARRPEVSPGLRLPQELETSKTVVQIENERFAIHREIEELPPGGAAVAVEASGQQGPCENGELGIPLADRRRNG